MTILQTAYDTLGNRGFRLETITKPLIMSVLAGSVEALPEYKNIYVVSNDFGINADIPSFTHPLVVEIRGQTSVAIDIRGFVPKKAEFVDVGPPPARTAFTQDYALMMYMAKFQLRWTQGDLRQLLSVSNIPMVAYADWISGAFSNKINPIETITLRILAGFFYYSQFTDDDQYGALERNTIIGSLSRNLRLLPKDVMLVVGDLDPIKDLNEFCEIVKETTASTRLNDLNAGYLISLLRMGWFGVASDRIVASAIEHPPTWMSLVAMALQSRVHNKTRISQAVNRALGRGDAGFVVKALDSAIESLDT